MFIQSHGKHAWNLAAGNVITLEDVDSARPLALEELDRELFLSRFQRTTPAERRYLAAMAELGSDAVRLPIRRVRLDTRSRSSRRRSVRVLSPRV